MTQQERSVKIINDSKAIGLPKCIRPSDIEKGNSKLNLIFLAHIFNHYPGLTANEDDFKAAKLIDDDNDVESSREERSKLFIFIKSHENVDQLLEYRRCLY